MNEAANSRHRVRFGVFEADLRAGELRKQGMKIKLQEKPFQILALLLEKPGELVTREEIRQRLWPEIFVDFENNLNTAATRLRQALGDSAENPRFVETVPRRGYRFIAPVEVMDASTEEPGNQAEARHNGTLSKDDAFPRFPRIRLSRLRAAALLAFVALAVGAYLLIPRLWIRGNASNRRVVLAVLPLENLSGDPEQEFFSEGLTDELITQLGRLQPEKLGVVARTTVMPYKGTQKPIGEISKELGAAYVLEGSVVRADGRVRVSVQLIQARDRTQLWSDSYERELANVLEVQSEIASRVARSLEIKLLPTQRESLAKAPSLDPEVYEDYLKGRFYWNQRTAQGLKKGLEYFQQAAAKDPNYAPAYVGQADSLLVLSDWGLIPPGPAYQQAKAAAMKALSINEALPEAHASLAGIDWEYDYEWAAGEKEFKRALELDPAYASGHQWYAEFLSASGRHNEAIAEMRRARDLDPRSLIINAEMAYILFYARRYDEAIEACKNTLEMDPNFMPALVYIQWAYRGKKMYDDWFREHQRAMVLAGADARDRAEFDRAYARGGYRGSRRWLVNLMLNRSKNEYVSPYTIGTIYADLGKRDQAFEWLEKAFEQRDPCLVRMNIQPELDPLRSDPRFENLLRRLRLSS
jgi:TolB-like protein/DNA-binding winged helix-turn-helix (wHTH) protein